MKPPAAGRVPFLRSLRFRLLLVVTGAFLALSLAGDFVVRHWDDLLYPEWYDPEFLRGRAAALEAAEAGEVPWETVYEEWEGTYGAVLYPQILLGALILSLVAGLGVALLATRRLQSLYRQVLRTDPERPEPFPVRGRDEIAVLARELNRLQERVQALLRELREREEARLQWVRQVAHDLRTPLAALQAALERAQREVPGQGGGTPAPGPPDPLEAARVDLERLQELVEDLLECARLDGGPELRAEPVPLGEVVQRAAAVVEELARQRGVRLEVEAAPGLPVHLGDGSRLQRALENLLRNALEHGAGRVVLRAAVEDGRIAFEVEDDGPGLLPPGERRSLAALHRELRDRGASGIGLEVVERVARLHGGEALVEGREGGGTRVHLRLPLRPPEGEAKEGAAGGADPQAPPFEAGQGRPWR